MAISSRIDYTSFKQATRHFKTTGGYLSLDAAQVFFLLNQIQKLGGVRGDILEVGAYQGRGSIFFTYLLSHGETLYVSDIFDKQELNVSQSLGLGFESWNKNFSSKRNPTSLFEVRMGPSFDLQASSLSKMRMAYLDGGHALDEVIADLQLADEVLVPGGIAIVDDVFNEDFPGTTEAIVRYCDMAESRLVPWLCFEGKIALSDASEVQEHHQTFSSFLDQQEHWWLPEQFFCGRNVSILKFRGPWERASLIVKKRAPTLHRLLRENDFSNRVFHRARGARRSGEK